MSAADVPRRHAGDRGGLRTALDALAGPAAARGEVALVGAGPGDPGLLGVRAVRLLSTATWVAYDRLAPRPALELCPPECVLRDVGKRPGHHAVPQEQINRLIVDAARAGHAVVRLKGGDPFVFGRGSEEAQACRRADVPVEVVPGVTSALAAPAYAGIPATARGTAAAFAVLTGSEDPAKPDSDIDWDAAARFPGTLMLLMAVAALPRITAALIAGGRDPQTPAAVIERGSLGGQRTVVASLSTVAVRAREAAVGAPAVVVIGEVVSLREQLGWFEGRALAGVRVLVPRARHQAGALSARLRALGAESIEAPTVALAPAAQPDALAGALERLAAGAFDWVALTSANGVAALWEGLRAAGRDARALAGVRVAAVGPGTAEALADRGVIADLLPARYTTAALAEALATREPARVLLPRADAASQTLSRTLRQAGWSVAEVIAYRVLAPPGLPPDAEEALRGGEVDVIAFTASSTVRNFVALFGGPPPPSVRVASIGPVTTATCAELGIRVDAEADPSDLDGLTRAVAATQALPTRR